MLNESIATRNINKYFHEFRLIGSYYRTNNPGDIDLLVVLKGDSNEESLIELILIIRNLIKEKSYSVISDSYFYPLISEYSKNTILHLIFFYSEESFELNCFSRLVKTHYDHTIILPSKERLSIILALQDILKLWLILKLNDLSSGHLNLLKNQIVCQMKKWLAKSSYQFMSENELKILNFIQDDIYRISNK